jgi:hypothetical protein
MPCPQSNEAAPVSCRRLCWLRGDISSKNRGTYSEVAVAVVVVIVVVVGVVGVAVVAAVAVVVIL